MYKRFRGTETAMGGRYLVLICMVTFGWGAGCSKVPQFPNRPMRVDMGKDGGRVLAFDTNKDHRPDYWQRQGRVGRKVELQFDGDKPAEVVLLDEVAGEDVVHFIIVMDGVPYSLVKELYEQGCFRLFYHPSRVVSCFPGMTDVAFQRVFKGRKPISYQATHFDRQKNRIVDGDELYLSGEAADWARKLDYRCSFKLDVLAYLHPEMVFEHELRGMTEVFDEAEKGTVIGYTVATAGLGTRGGREAILGYLRVIDRFCEEMVYKRRGKVKITLLADHGHNMSGRGRITFDHLLGEAGYRLGDKLENSKDVVAVQFGLLTYVAFFTDEPAAVAKVLLREPATTLACYPMNNSVVVQSLDGKAIIRESNGRYSYTPEFGDPLELNDIINELRATGKVDERGFIDDRAFLAASIGHIYPDPLRRIWQAFNVLVRQPADLIVCLKDGWVHGSNFFHVMIGDASSTHGGLNQLNSMTFAMSMWGPLPEFMRLEEVMPAVEQVCWEKKNRK